MQQRSHGERDINGLLVQSNRRLLVKFNQAGVWGLSVDKGSVSFGLELRGDVHDPTFTSTCPQATFEPWPIVGQRVNGYIVEFARLPRVEFPGRKLLVDLDAAHETELLGVECRWLANFALRFIGHDPAKGSTFMSTTLD